MCVGRSRADTLLHYPQRAAVARSLCIGKSLPRARRSASSGRHGRCGARIQRGRAGSLVTPRIAVNVLPAKPAQSARVVSRTRSWQIRRADGLDSNYRTRRYGIRSGEGAAASQGGERRCASVGGVRLSVVICASAISSLRAEPREMLATILHDPAPSAFLCSDHHTCRARDDRLNRPRSS